MSIEDNLKKLDEKLKIIEEDLKNHRKEIDDLDQKLTRRLNGLENLLKKVNQFEEHSREHLWNINHLKKSSAKINTR